MEHLTVERNFEWGAELEIKTQYFMHFFGEFLNKCSKGLLTRGILCLAIDILEYAFN